MDIEQRNIDSITPYENNPRINDAAIDAVAASIDEFGFQQPIVVDADGVIIVGHTRWKAARKLGLVTVPVHVASDLSPEQVKTYRLADNATGDLAKWDMDKLTLELDNLDMGSIPGMFDTTEEATLETPGIKRPPAYTWVLVGIPTAEYATIAEDIESLADKAPFCDVQVSSHG